MEAYIVVLASESKSCTGVVVVFTTCLIFDKRDLTELLNKVVEPKGGRNWLCKMVEQKRRAKWLNKIVEQNCWNEMVECARKLLIASFLSQKFPTGLGLDLEFGIVRVQTALQLPDGSEVTTLRRYLRLGPWKYQRQYELRTAGAGNTMATSPQQSYGEQAL